MQLTEILRNLGPVRIAAMSAAALVILGFFIFVITRVSSTEMSLLYGDLDTGDSSEIVSSLEQQGIPFELRNNGRQIYIPSENVQRVRLSLAENGLPTGGSLGYEIFDRSGNLGTTNFVQNVNLVRALEGELARTIRSFDTIDGARVHLVLPRRELFSRETRSPSASVVIKSRGNRRLENSQVRAIQNLVASAVDGLTPGRISIVDDKGNLLAQSQDSTDGIGSTATLEEARLEAQARLRGNIERLIERIVGLGKVRAEVSVDMNFDRVTESDETYDPLGQVERSTQRISENSKELEGNSENTVTVANNLPETQAEESASGGPTNSIETNRTEETINYEITKSTTTRVQESGDIERLTVAVLVDGTQSSSENGEITYTPRSPQELEKIAALVKSTVGFDEDRGDRVEVINMRFAPIDVPLQLEEATYFGLSKADLFKISEIIIFLIIGILIILFVLRPIINRTLSAMDPATSEAEGMDALEGSESEQAIEGPDIEAQAALKAQSEEEMLVSLGAVEGQLKSGTLDKIGELIDKHPDAAVSVLKSWVRED
ncbi:flagellar basal-body MS-ring/collar protein FliF [Alphaproteobacteria bacterium]|nr:flagellar basal-body MS-ring/collar protein FliF [Alphaproteobacteria bacterium]